MPRVFISHKNVDSDLAAKVSTRVNQNGVATYLDVVDDALDKDGPDLASYLLDRMSKCDQLIAVVSYSTKNSWWVPWEIGVGSEKGFRMASYSESYVDLPSYLTKWPDLRTLNDVDLFCKLSQSAEASIQQRNRSYFDDQSRFQVRKSEAVDFHKILKAELARKRF